MAQWIIAKITRLSSVEESTARLFRQSKMTSILVVELHDFPYLQVHIHMFWLQMPVLSIAQMYHNLKSQSDHLSQFPD